MFLGILKSKAGPWPRAAPGIAANRKRIGGDSTREQVRATRIIDVFRVHLWCLVRGFPADADGPCQVSGYRHAEVNERNRHGTTPLPQHVLKGYITVCHSSIVDCHDCL